RGSSNRVNDVHPFDDFAVDRVVAVKLRHWSDTYEKLAGRTVDVVPPSGRKNAAFVLQGIRELSLDGGLGGLPPAPGGWVSVDGIGVAALNCDGAARFVLHDPVNPGSVVEALLDEFLEVLDMVRRGLWIELNNYPAVVSLEHGNFV